MNPAKFKVAFVVGTLGQGGAEKQLLYTARALVGMGASVRVFSLTRGEFYEAELCRCGLEVQWVGRWANPLVRLLTVGRALSALRPDVVHSSHFYTNLYAAIPARLAGITSVGALRSDTVHELQQNPRWGDWLLRWPHVLACNSVAGYRNACVRGVPEEQLAVLSNVIDLDDLDAQVLNRSRVAPHAQRVVAIAVSHLISVKRLDRFIRALAMARQEVPALQGVIVGQGPERERLESLARELGLTERDLVFAGASDDVPGQMSQAHMLVHTSDHEGFPNVLLEAMAARLPVVTTPAGDAARIVKNQVTGFVVPFEDCSAIAERIVALASSPESRGRMGAAARSEVEKRYSCRRLPALLVALYRQAAERAQSKRVHSALSRLGPRGVDFNAN